MTGKKQIFSRILYLSLCIAMILSGCSNAAVSDNHQAAATAAPKQSTKSAPLPAPTAQIAAVDEAAAVSHSPQENVPQDDPQTQEITEPEEIEGGAFSGEYLNKVEASELLRRGMEVEIVAVGPRYFDFTDEEGKLYRVETPIKPKFIERYVNEYGYSNERIRDGFEPGMKGVLKSSNPPQNIMGVGPGDIIGVTPEASDGVEMQDVMPLFTLTTPSVVGPNDRAIREEMDYNPSSRDSSVKKRWFEIFRGITKGVIWTIFEQSNRYFTMVDKREWDRYTPGRIFDLMMQFEYLVPIPDRLLAGRDPKNLTTEQKLENRYVIHDYSFGQNTVRVLVPTYTEFDNAVVLTPLKDDEQEIGYISINKALTDAEMADGEKFTWNVPLKVIVSIKGDEYALYLPSQAVIDINGNLYKLPR